VTSIPAERIALDDSSCKTRELAQPEFVMPNEKTQKGAFERATGHKSAVDIKDRGDSSIPHLPTLPSFGTG
jgi:hypothetical protein